MQRPTTKHAEKGRENQGQSIYDYPGTCKELFYVSSSLCSCQQAVLFTEVVVKMNNIRNFLVSMFKVRFHKLPMLLSSGILSHPQRQ